MVLCPQRCRALRELVLRDMGGEGSIPPALVHSNFVEFSGDGSSITIHIHDHKTSDSHPPMIVAVTAAGNSSEVGLFRSITTFVRSFRHLYMHPGTDDEGLLFLTNQGRRFSDAEFSNWIASSFERETGVRMSFNLLRSSFVTAMLSHESGSRDPSIREGVASCMSSSETYQRQSYDRRQRTEVRRRGLEFAHSIREEYDVDERDSSE